MSELIACLIAYNEADLLPGCLDSLVGKADRIILVDGRIATFPGDGVGSDDSTVDIAKSYGIEVIQSDKAWPDEITMRNQYLKGKDGDWYFMIDADETLLTPLPYPDDLPANAMAYKVELRMLHSYNEVICPVRLFRHVGHMEYRDVHHALYSDGMLVSHPKYTPFLGSVQMVHRQILRSRRRWQDKRIKRLQCYDHEKEHRARLGL